MASLCRFEQVAWAIRDRARSAGTEPMHSEVDAWRLWLRLAL